MDLHPASAEFYRLAWEILSASRHQWFLYRDLLDKIGDVARGEGGDTEEEAALASGDYRTLRTRKIFSLINAFIGEGIVTSLPISQARPVIPSGYRNIINSA